MVDPNYTVDRLLAFLREAPEQGVLNSAVARSRVNAIDQLVTVLSPEERADIRLIDVTRLAGRLHTLEGSTLRPEVVDLYRTRVNEALVDYLAWLANPKTFATITGHALRRDRFTHAPESENVEERRAIESIALATSERRKDYVSVPLRDGVTVFITNLPLDLTAEEAGRLARVITALGSSESTGTGNAQ